MRRDMLKWLVFSVLSAGLIVACAGTELTPTYMDEGRSGKPVSSILVIGAAHKEGMRRFFENTFVTQLKAAGVEAFSSADVIAVPADLEFRKEMILKAVDEFKCDAVIITFLLGIDRKETLNRSDPYIQSYYGFYEYVYSYTHDPGHSSLKTIVRMSTHLYDVRTEKLIWSGKSKTLNPESASQAIDAVVHAVIKALQKNKLIQQPE